MQLISPSASLPILHTFLLSDHSSQALQRTSHKSLPISLRIAVNYPHPNPVTRCSLVFNCSPVGSLPVCPISQACSACCACPCLPSLPSPPSFQSPSQMLCSLSHLLFLTSSANPVSSMCFTTVPWCSISVPCLLVHQVSGWWWREEDMSPGTGPLLRHLPAIRVRCIEYNLGHS